VSPSPLPRRLARYLAGLSVAGAVACTWRGGGEDKARYRPLQILLLRLGYSAHLAHCCSNFRAAAAELVVVVKAAAALLWLAAVAVAAEMVAAGAGLPAGQGWNFHFLTQTALLRFSCNHLCTLAHRLPSCNQQGACSSGCVYAGAWAHCRWWWMKHCASPHV
jgi:hypothetical protein